MKIKLNDNQKKFLIDNGYVTAKSVDAVNHNKLYTYFMVEYDWILDTELNRFYMNDLVLEPKTKMYNFDFNYELFVNFQDDDYNLLLNIK